MYKVHNIFNKEYKVWSLSCCSDTTMRTLYIELTTICNARCGFCSAEHGNDSLPLDKLKIVLDELVGKVVDKISITGGEPLLYPDLEELLNLLDSYKELKFYAITTNGILLKDNLDLINKSNVKYINLSRHSHLDEENNEVFHRRTISTKDIKELVSKCHKSIRINNTMNEFSNIDKMVYFCNEVGVKHLLFRKDYFDVTVKEIPFEFDKVKESDKCICRYATKDGVSIEYREVDMLKEKNKEESNQTIRNLVLKANGTLQGGWSPKSLILN